MTRPLDLTEPSEALQPWALRNFERAYGSHQVRRPRCSKADFWTGYRAALIDLKAWSQFRVRPPEDDA